LLYSSHLLEGKQKTNGVKYKQMEFQDMKIRMILVALAVTACGQQTATSSIKDDSVARQPSLCETYAATEDMIAYKSVNPLDEAVSDLEKVMIQTAVLVTGLSAPVTPDQAVDIFSDRENGGSLGGTVSYYKIMHRGSEKTLANVTFYPGDNEYGSLFQIWTYGAGSQSAGIIGTIGDSDIYCLTPAN